MKAYQLRLEFQKLLEIPDPPHCLMLLGIYEAKSWFLKLSEDDQTLLGVYLIQEFKTASEIEVETWSLFLKILDDSILIELRNAIDIRNKKV